MSIYRYLKDKGIKRAIQVIWQYKIDLIFQKLILPFVKNKPIKEIIVIESHNDFDCNGGVFYEYLIRNGYNEKYKIVWLLKHAEKRPQNLPVNVECYALFSPSIKKDLRICTCKYLLADNVVTRKRRPEQKSIFLGHGTGGLKNVKGLIVLNRNVDYVLVQSHRYAPIQAVQYGLENTPEKMIYIGYPIHDELLKEDRSEILKITTKKFNKIILWMPTFRKGTGYRRDDGGKAQKLGIPLLQNLTEYEQLNEFLSAQNALLIIKLHPMQNLDNLKVTNISNITVLTGSNVKEKGIDNYRLMRSSDALISDYSGVAYDYLQLNRPIGYVLDDMNEYKPGFVVPNIHELLAGDEIYTLQDMYVFISNIVNGVDIHKNKRKRIRDYIYEYHDQDNCKRLAEFMGI